MDVVFCGHRSFSKMLKRHQVNDNNMCEFSNEILRKVKVNNRSNVVQTNL